MKTDAGSSGQTAAPTSSTTPTCVDSPLNMILNPFGTAQCIGTKIGAGLANDLNKGLSATVKVLNDNDINLFSTQNKITGDGNTASPTQTTTPTANVAPQIYLFGGQGGSQTGNGNSDKKSTTGSPLDFLSNPLVLIGAGLVALLGVFLFVGGKKK